MNDKCDEVVLETGAESKGEMKNVIWASYDYIPGEKKLLHKIDRALMPIIFVAYGVQVLEKVVLGYAAIYGIQTDLHLVGQDYSWASGIFYFGYLFWEYPATYLMRYFPVSKYLGIVMTLWGVVSMLVPVCSNYGGLLANRFVLGALEAVAAPAFLLITAGWYKRTEQPLRQIVWFSATPVFAFIGGLLGYGLGIANTSLASWKVIYLVFGAFAIVWGPVMYFFLPSSPGSAKFLNEEEKIFAESRLAGDSAVMEHFWKWYQVLRHSWIPKRICSSV